LKTAGRRHGKTRHLGDNCAQRTMPQPFLETGEQRLLIARLHIDDAVGQETGLGDGGRKEILPGHTPQHPAFCARRNSSGKERSGRAIDRTVAASGHFMQSAESQPAFGQMLVDCFDTERQHSLSTRAAPFETLNALSKRFEDRRGVDVRMSGGNSQSK
jgi:hypothetical protein